MKISGEIWVQEESTKNVFCITGNDFNTDPHTKQGDSQDYTVSYDTGDFKIEYHIEERPEGRINYTSTPELENCRVIKDELRFL